MGSTTFFDRVFLKEQRAKGTRLNKISERLAERGRDDATNTSPAN